MRRCKRLHPKWRRWLDTGGNPGGQAINEVLQGVGTVVKGELNVVYSLRLHKDPASSAGMCWVKD